MARYCVGSVDSSTAVLGSAVHYSPVRYSETVLTSVGTRRRRRRSSGTHITLLHTPQFHRPTHVRCRVTNVSRIRRSRDGSRPTAPGPRTFRRFRSGPDTPRPSPAPRPDTRVRPPRPRSGRRGRATARSSVQRDACPRDERRGNAAAAVGRRKARRAIRPRPERETGFLITLWPAHYCNFHTEFLRYHSSAVMRCKHL